MDFLKRTPTLKIRATTVDKWDYMKVLLHSKGTFIRVKRQPTAQEKIYTRYTSDGG